MIHISVVTSKAIFERTVETQRGIFFLSLREEVARIVGVDLIDTEVEWSTYADSQTKAEMTVRVSFSIGLGCHPTEETVGRCVDKIARLLDKERPFGLKVFEIWVIPLEGAKWGQTVPMQ